jgi:3-oxoacyl-[acyl-carrier protein] reductase
MRPMHVTTKTGSIFMELGIKNKVALVLGGGGGLGGAIAQALAGEGVKVAVADIQQANAQATVDKITQAGQKAMALQWDLGDLNCIDDKVRQIEAELGPVDILVNNTGGPPPTPAHGQKAELWRTHFDSMVLSVIAITDRVLPGMRERKWGRIITSTSSGVIAPIANLGLSNALRLSLVGWSKTLAREIGRDGITANIILPGRIATARITYLDEAKAQREGRPVAEVAAESTASIPVGRYGKPQEYGDMVTFLASERASYITGSVIRVDGGLIASI